MTEMLRGYLESILEEARKKKLAYADFFRIFATYLYPSKSDLIDFYDILRSIKSFADKIAEASHNLRLMKRRVSELAKKGYRPLLVDCLGLPEIYEIYKRISERCGILAVSVEPYVNTSALTDEFKKVYGSRTMLELAKRLGTILYKNIDETVHNELGKPMELNSLLELAKSKLRRIAESLADDAMRNKKAFIASDHGYDVHFELPDKYYLRHGHKSRLARVAPLIIVECRLVRDFCI